MKNLVYLHPYVYVDSVKKGSLLINTLDGYVKTFESGVVDSLIRKLNKNNYVTELSKEDLLNDNVITFLAELKNNFLGNYIRTNNVIPVQLIPNPRLVGNNENNISNLGISDSGENLLDYIYQINIHINSLSHIDIYDNAFRQVNFPMTNHSKVYLDIENLKCIFEKFQKIDIVYKLIFGDFISEGYFIELQKLILKENRRVNFIFYYKTIINNLIFFEKLNVKHNINYEIWFDNFSDHNIYERMAKSKFNFNQIKFKAMITKEDEIDELEDLNKFFKQFVFEIHPIYNGNNFIFFEENVFVELDDLLQQEISLLNIQQKNILNPLSFGNLYILNNGDTYSNLNLKKLGNIINDPIGNIIIKEFKVVKAWFANRLNRTPCKDCIYRLLCPPITNYEFLKHKFDFCKIHNTDNEN